VIAGGQHYIVFPSRSDVIRLWWMGDWHLWNRGCARQMLERDLESIAEDDASFLLGGGDYAEYIGYQDRRFDPEAFSPDVKVRDLGRLGYRQAEDVRDLLWPVRRKVVGLMYGNHEAKYMNAKDAQQLHSWLCTELGVPDFGYSCMFDLLFQRHSRGKIGLRRGSLKKGAVKTAWRVRVFAHHGAGAATTVRPRHRGAS